MSSGAAIRSTSGPASTFICPPPFGRGDAVDVDLVREVAVGFRGETTGRRAGLDELSFYLTADENILDVRSVLHYRVLDPVAFTLGAGEVDETLRRSDTWNSRRSHRRTADRRALHDRATSNRSGRNQPTARRDARE